MLTEKQKSFCREYFTNGGNGTLAYLTTYNSNNEAVAANESSLLLKREEIQEYLQAMNKPLEAIAISERERKRSILWQGIEECREAGDHAAVARYLDILNRMDNEYTNINRNINTNESDITNLDTNTLKLLTGSA
jgi:phage terminase small subunit